MLGVLWWGGGDRQQAIHSFSFVSSHQAPVEVGRLMQTKAEGGAGLQTANKKPESHDHGKRRALELSDNSKLSEDRFCRSQLNLLRSIALLRKPWRLEMAVTNLHYITRMSSGFKVYILEGNYYVLYLNTCLNYEWHYVCMFSALFILIPV